MLGGTTLTNIVVTDDNGTPSVAGDDFTVGTIASLAPGASATLTATVIPVVTTVGVVNGVTVPAGLVITTLPSGDIKVTYLQDFGINDNTYGTGAMGWPETKIHKFSDLTGSDKLEFRFSDKNGTNVLDSYVDEVHGSDVTGDGSSASPWRTITHALEQVGPPDVIQIHVAPGTYDAALGGVSPLPWSRTSAC